MADKIIKKDELVKLLGIELTEEQLAKLKDLKVELPKQTKPEWAEAKKLFKKEIGQTVKSAVMERFKNFEKIKDDESTIKEQPRSFSIDEVNKLIDEKTTKIRNEILVDSALSRFSEADRSDAKLLINGRISAGQSINESIAEVTKKLQPEQKGTKKLINDFGSQVQETTGEQTDKFAQALDDEIKRAKNR